MDVILDGLRTRALWRQQIIPLMLGNNSVCSVCHCTNPLFVVSFEEKKETKHQTKKNTSTGLIFITFTKCVFRSFPS